MLRSRDEVRTNGRTRPNTSSTSSAVSLPTACASVWGCRRTEHQHSGGYSEYTQETDYEHEITCGSHEIHLGTVYWGNGLEALLKWLDRVDEGL